MSDFYFSCFQFYLKVHCGKFPQNLIQSIDFIRKQDFPGESLGLPQHLVLLKKCLTDAFSGVAFDYPEIWLDFSSLTPKEMLVLKTLKKIPMGQTISYAKLGQKAGFSSQSGRFIGNVMAKNPFPVIFPCHRVILSNGKLGQYTGGVAIKQFLLSQEKSVFYL